MIERLTYWLVVCVMWAMGLLTIYQLVRMTSDEVVPVVQLEPIQAVVLDPVASHLDNWRWPCSGDGCANSNAIGRIATSVRYHSKRTGISQRLLVGILMVENPWLDTTAVSYAGAVGLMQVMPMHTEAWPECTLPLESIEGSICRGASIISAFMLRGNETQALLRYNGCRQRYCQGYPRKVLQEAELYDG